MRARTLYNNTRTRVFAGAGKALAALAVLLLISCSSDTVIKEIPEIDINGTDPIGFSCNVQDNQNKLNMPQPTRAQLLSTGFAVSTYKLYATARQQVVMKDYEVEIGYSGSAWDGSKRPYWDYSNVPGQYERFWDYSGFPYRFHALAPCPKSMTGFVLDDKNIRIPKPYLHQTCINGLVENRDADCQATNISAEPYMLAQVERRTDGTDRDFLAHTEDKANINTGSTSRNREVWMPFHHLNSKIRFGVYTLHPWASANHLYIKDLTVKVTSNNFVTAATGFEASCNASSALIPTSPDYGFTGITQKASTQLQPLLHFDGGEDVEGNDLFEAQTQRTAYMLQCPQGIMQLPQRNVQMSVSFELYSPDDDSTPYKTYENVPISIEMPDNTLNPLHDWLPGYIYTYYLVISGFDDKLEITFTATLTPWDDVSGSLTTDLEQ